MSAVEHKPRLWDKARNRLAALVLIGIIVGIFALTVAMYQDAFTPSADVTVKAERAGLQMRPGTVVKLRGVDVGKIGDVKTDPDGGVDITLTMQPDKLPSIPANVGVSLEQLTAFGNKSVELTLPAQPSADHLQAGSVVDARNVSVEVNTVFDKLDKVLTALPAAKVNEMLGAIAGTVQGHGDELGNTINTLDQYLAKFNQNLPQLRTDFDKGSRVLDVYAAATPDLMKILANGSTTADSIVAEQGNLHNTLDSLRSMSDVGSAFLQVNATSLLHVLSSALPTTTLLQKYSPEITCFLQGMDKANQMQSKNFGTIVPGVTADIFLLPGNEPYKNPQNLPVMAATGGPNCNGLPGLDGTHVPPSLLRPVDAGGDLNQQGPNRDQDTLAKEPLVVQLFGPLATLGDTPVGLPAPKNGATR